MSFFPNFQTKFKIKESIQTIDAVGGYGARDPWERHYLKSPFKKENLKGFLAFIFVLTIILGGRIFYLQIIKGDFYYSLAEGNRIKRETVKAKRGVIYDRHFQQIAFNDPNFSLVINPNEFFQDQNKPFYKDCFPFSSACLSGAEEFLKNFIVLPESTADQEGIFQEMDKFWSGFSKEEISSSGDYLVLEKIPYRLALPLLVKSKKAKGIKIKIDSARRYQFPRSLSQVVGYIGRISKEELKENPDYLLNDYIGKNGLERYYEQYLKGKDGWIDYEVNALGERTRIIRQLSPQAGDNLILSIDLGLQEKAEEILKKHLSQKRKKRAAIVIINPQNGEVLSLISWPSFSSNQFAYRIDPQVYAELLKDPNQPLFNRAIMGEYPSGSIIKPVIACALLEEGVITPRTTFLSTGGIRVGKWFFPDWKPGGHGRVNVVQAIAHSVNTFFYIAVGGYNKFSGLGVEKLKEYEELFGINQKTGIDWPYEAKGFFPTSQWKEKTKGEPWYIGDTYHLAIGQGDLLVTPLQAAVFTSIIANGGIFYRPHLVKKIVSDNGQTIKEIKPQIIREGFIKKENIKIVQAGMRQCVREGSCRLLSSLPVKTAGKTGTAQHGGSSQPHSWFVAFAPYSSPKVAMAVLVEDGGEGHALAEPIAKEILEYIFSKKEPPS